MLRAPRGCSGAPRAGCRKGDRRAARGTPRVANNLLRRVRDYAEVRSDGVIRRDTALALLEIAQVDEQGLDRFDRKILESLLDNFAGGPGGGQPGRHAGDGQPHARGGPRAVSHLPRLPAADGEGRMITDRGARHLGRAASGTLFRRRRTPRPDPGAGDRRFEGCGLPTSRTNCPRNSSRRRRRRLGATRACSISGPAAGRRTWGLPISRRCSGRTICWSGTVTG